MSSSWGNDQHGPGGDPSWLGGKDRETAGGGTGGGQSSGWSSDFSSDPGASAADSDFGTGDQSGQGSSGALPVRGPQFGRVDEANARQSSQDDRGWMSEFTGDRGGRPGGGRQTKGLGMQLLIGAVAIGIIIFAATMTGSFSGSNLGFFLLVFILPIVKRVIRNVTGGNRRR